MDRELAKRLFKENRYKEALIIYDKIYQKNSDQSEEFLKEYAWCLQERLRYKESTNITLEVLERSDTDTQALLNYTICLGKQNYHKEALRQYEKILGINKDYKDQIGYYAYLLERTGDLEKAIEFYQKGLDYEPENLWYLSHYAFCLQKAHKYEDAQTFFEKSLDMDPTNTWTIKRYAFFKNEVMGKEIVYDYYSQLISNDPYNINHYINFAEILMINNDLKEAYEILKETEAKKKPLVIKIIICFYYSVYFLIKEMYQEADNYFATIDELIKDYKSYIHRDFTDLQEYIVNNFNKRQKDFYYRILKKATNS